MVPRINLLPWRQRKRDRQRRVFFAQLGGVAAAAASLVLMASIVLDRRIGHQDARNAYLSAHIADLRLRIDEIDGLRRRTDGTLAHLETLAGLHRDRAHAVRTFDELARTIPPGVQYTSLAQRGGLITARGVVRSNRDISTLMRNIENSARFEHPQLKGIEEADHNVATGAGVFELTFATSAAPAAPGHR